MKLNHTEKTEQTAKGDTKNPTCCLHKTRCGLLSTRALFFTFLGLFIVLGFITLRSLHAEDMSANLESAESLDMLDMLESSPINPEIEAIGGDMLVQGGASATGTLPAQNKVVGMLDLRPSWMSSTNTYDTQNNVLAGYRIGNKMEFNVYQEFNTGIYNPAAGTQPSQMELSSGQGYAGTKFMNIWSDARVAPKTSLTYNPRFYFPTRPADADRGMITQWRNYLVLNRKLSDTVSFTFMEIPILHAYSRPGTVFPTGGGKGVANPIVENRFYLITDFSFFKGKLNLSLPVFIHLALNRPFAPDPMGGKVGYVIYTWPELVYNMHPNMQVGMAVFTDNLVASDLSDVTWETGFRNTTYQGIMRFTF